MIKYVFMDIDDTLLDFGKAEAAAIKKTFERIGVPATPEVISRYSEINDEHWKMLERGELTREQVLVYRFDALFAELGIKNVPSEMAQASYEYLLGIGHYFVDGAPELLEALKGKYELYIVSNGTASVQDSRLESAGIAPYFKDIFISHGSKLLRSHFASSARPAVYQDHLFFVPKLCRWNASDGFHWNVDCSLDVSFVKFLFCSHIQDHYVLVVVHE